MEKRKYPRKTFIKLGTSEGGDCEILNLSEGGVCIFCDRAYRVGDIVSLMVPRQRKCTVRWIIPTFDRFKMGLKFLS
jgi:hypothetical protein